MTGTDRQQSVAERARGPRGLYLGALAVEAVVIVLLWLAGRHFGG